MVCQDVHSISDVVHQSQDGHVTDKKVAIVGAGLVGSLNACYLARRGYDVHLYEYRNDIRTMEHVAGRSINLSLSVRGRTALARVGLEQSVIEQHAIPMYARMVHDLNGTLRPLPYGTNQQCIYSVGRRFLNEKMLSEAEKYDNVTFHFNHKLISASLEKGTMLFQSDGETVQHEADLVLGCDGAYSNVRKQMMKRARFDYSQTYIPHGYMELCIPATNDGQFAMPPNYLHLWPRGRFMLIALPNQDCSWTVTLFMPFTEFDALTTPDKLLAFFRQHYPDSLPLIGEQKLVQDFFANKALPLVSIKCSPYHVGDRSLLMGDAAHAMVPFYGQGMNAGFEDCLLLDELLNTHGDDLGLALSEYSILRQHDAAAICDLAMYNYIEMRDLVNSRTFLLRKKLDRFLHTVFPNHWTPLYSMVSFTRIRYHQVITLKKWQDKMVSLGLCSLGAMVLSSVATIIYSSYTSLQHHTGHQIE